MTILLFIVGVATLLITAACALAFIDDDDKDI